MSREKCREPGERVPLAHLSRSRFIGLMIDFENECKAWDLGEQKRAGDKTAWDSLLGFYDEMANEWREMAGIHE